MGQYFIESSKVLRKSFTEFLKKIPFLWEDRESFSTSVYDFLYREFELCVYLQMNKLFQVKAKRKRKAVYYLRFFTPSGSHLNVARLVSIGQSRPDCLQKQCIDCQP